jgi:pimeloyl-ACP methyl ester carboxylesterase
VTRAVVVIHGSSRSSSDAFDSVKAVVPSDVLVVAPRFKTSSDSPTSSELYWTKSGWNQGADSTGSLPWRISSFEAASVLLTEMRATYPNLDTIVIAGHSAGGQFAQRLAATNTDARNHFVVANPSSYLYFDDLRPVGSGFGKPSDACSWYNNYRYGLDDRTEDSPYMGNISRATLTAQYGQSRVTYLLGAKDTDPSASDLDVSCEAMAQGAHRLERGQKFYQHLPAVFGSGITARHSLSVVSNVGHSASQMFSSSAGRAALVR